VTRVIVHRLAGSKKAQDACRLVEALFHGGRRVAVWVADPGRASILDGYLWTFAQYSFVPHVLVDGGGEVDDPVVVVTGAFANPNGAEILVVADRLDQLDGAAAFAEVHDLVTPAAEDAGKLAAWQATGFEVEEVTGI
jgi:DNA polymerase IIIc chi subunit